MRGSPRYERIIRGQNRQSNFTRHLPLHHWLCRIADRIVSPQSTLAAFVAGPADGRQRCFPASYLCPDPHCHLGRRRSMFHFRSRLIPSWLLAPLPDWRSWPPDLLSSIRARSGPRSAPLPQCYQILLGLRSVRS